MEAIQLSKDKAKEQIRYLITDFKLNYSQHKKELEANTETKLIEPLFEILGWTKNDFVKQEKARRGEKFGHADYAFKINDKIVFLLEVKKLGIQLEKEADKQVISYALSKRVPFAVSTNFEKMNIFCVEQEGAINNKFRVFNTSEDYLNNFEDLLFLSKQSFEHGLTLKKAQDEGRLKKRASIDKYLLEDFMIVRKLISDDIEKSYPHRYQINEKDEIVQRIIDRLIFIRRCEDIGINPKNMRIDDVNQHPDNKAYPILKKIFEEYNNVYNSGLFLPAKDNDCDIISINGTIIKKLTTHLYESKEGNYIYNFDWIDADILGQVYEQYLGKILSQTKSGRAKLTDGQSHRKEQGIYYTPTYIVDYIVKNTIGELLKDKKVKAKDLKILDPACGSGSFLIKAFDYMNEELSNDEEATQYKLDSQGHYSIKTDILKKNIYGVDLDNKAVEITKLNLLLKAAENGRKLPEEVDLHIRHGNSLINDEAVAGLNIFKWEDDFKAETFDVIIGNPPYGAMFSNEEKQCFDKNYKFNKSIYESYRMFFERGTQLLKNGGYLGLIIPNTWFYLTNAKEFRKSVLVNFQIQKLINLPQNVFEDATVDTCIVILKKVSPKDNMIKTLFFSYKEIISSLDNVTYNLIKQKEIIENNESIINLKIKKEDSSVINKIKNQPRILNDFVNIITGIKPYQVGKGNPKQTKKILLERPYTATYKKDESFKPYLTGKFIGRYITYQNKEYLSYGEWLAEPKTKDIFESERIILQQIRNPSLPRRLIGTIIIGGVYTNNGLHNLLIKKGYNLKWVIGILNSKLMNYYFSCHFNDVNIKPSNLYELPYPEYKENNKLEISIDKMLSLNKRLNEIGDKKTSETAKIEEEIKKTDAEIDELVYKLYDITSEERVVIEQSLN